MPGQLAHSSELRSAGVVVVKSVTVRTDTLRLQGENTKAHLEEGGRGRAPAIVSVKLNRRYHDIDLVETGLHLAGK